MTKLALTFSTSKNTYGTFAWSGDALTWTVSGITRPNNAAWLVCANQQLFINLGSYGYMTPAGCADQTVSLLERAHVKTDANVLLRSITTTIRRQIREEIGENVKSV